MILDDVKRIIQSFFDVETLTVVGSGLSVSEGIPGMKELAELLVEQVPKGLSDFDISNWHLISEDLKQGTDLETAMQNNPPNKEVEEQIVKVTYNFISEKDRDVFYEILQKQKVLRFSNYLSMFHTDLYPLTVITTNYDLLIEYACENLRVAYNDSYVGKIIADFNPELATQEISKATKVGSKLVNNKNGLRLYKPHGSINWKIIDNRLIKVNHFDCGSPCIITPGTNKYLKGYDEPYDYHIGAIGAEFDKAKKIVFIGYGFNDEHLQTHFSSLKNRNKPMLIITRTLSDKAKMFVNGNKEIIALEYSLEDGQSGTKIHWENEVEFFKGLNMWDLRELVKEVFNE